MNRLLSYLLIFFCLTSCIKEKQTGADLAPGDRIPDFTVVMNDGAEVTGESLREGVSVIVFFTTECPDCRKTLPEIQKIYDEYLSHGVRFAVISREDGPESVAGYWSEQGFTMSYSAQNDRRVYELFARTRVPRIYICRDGVIRSVFTDNPSPKYENLQENLSVLL